MIRSPHLFAFVFVAVGVIRLLMGRGWLDAVIWWVPAAVILILHFLVRRRRR